MRCLSPWNILPIQKRDAKKGGDGAATISVASAPTPTGRSISHLCRISLQLPPGGDPNTLSTRSPFQYLGYDILSQIFLDSLKDDAKLVPNINTAPLKFGRVCSHWRWVALSTPLLWSRLSIIIDLRDGDPRPFELIDALSANTLKQYLTRSNSAPLSLFYEHRRSLNLRGMTLLMKGLIEHAMRLGSLRLEAPIYIAEPIMHGLQSYHGVLLLQVLDVRIISGACLSVEDVDTSTSAHQILPLHTDITSKGLMESSTLSFWGLRSIQMHGIDAVDAFLEWLPWCTALEHAVFAFTLEMFPRNPLFRLDRSSAFSGFHHVELPCLITLKLLAAKASDSWSVQYLLDHFTAPALRELSLICESSAALREQQRNNFSSCIHKFIERSAPPLENICLKQRSWITAAVLRNILAMTPALRKLIISHLANDDIFEDLTFQSHVSQYAAQTPLCPLLVVVEFNLDFFALHHDNKNKLINLISSRWRTKSISFGESRGGRSNQLGDLIPNTSRLEKIVINPFFLYETLIQAPVIAHCVAQGLQLEVGVSVHGQKNLSSSSFSLSAAQSRLAIVATVYQ